MNKTQVKGYLVEKLKTVCENVSSQYIEPDYQFQETASFPMIILAEVGTRPEPASPRGFLQLSIFGIVRGDRKELGFLRDRLDDKIANALISRRDKIQVNILSVSSPDFIIDQPGLSPGIMFPYAIIRFDIETPYSREVI